MDDKFQLFDCKIVGEWDQERIDDIFDGRIDIEFALAAYRSKTLIMVYKYAELFGTFTIRTHAISLKYSLQHQAWVVRDSNEPTPWVIAGYEKTRLWLSLISQAQIYAFACV